MHGHWTYALLVEHLVNDHYVDEGFAHEDDDLLYVVNAHEECHKADTVTPQEGTG